MPITVTLNFETESDLVSYFNRRAGSPFVAGPTQSAPPGPPAMGHTAMLKRQPGRPRKAPVEADVKVVEDAQPAAPALVQPFDPAVGDPLPETMEADAPKVVEPEAPKAPAEPEKTEFSEEDLTEAMKAYSAKLGIDALRQLLINTTGKARRSEIPKEDFGKVVKALNAELRPQ